MWLLESLPIESGLGLALCVCDRENSKEVCKKWVLALHKMTSFLRCSLKITQGGYFCIKIQRPLNYRNYSKGLHK